jgi:hypothetical protein
MSMYIIFFGKSQDFTTCFYDRDSPIHDFNSVIKDFDSLESKVFTVDDIKNKEILSRYFFSAQGSNYCLLKLYSFAQAYSGNRIAGSIYGVGLLSDKVIDITRDNLALLRAAKDNFAKLSLDGFKFNKSNFKDDADRIWKAIVTRNDGNLIDKVDTSTLKINGSEGQVAFYVKDLFSDAIKLNNRANNQDNIYFSEDLEHLKRTQNKWGKNKFSIYWEQNNQFVPYTEPLVVVSQTQTPKGTNGDEKSNGVDSNDIAKLRAELSDKQYNNRKLQSDIDKLKEKQKPLVYTICGLAGFIVFLLLYNLISGSSEPEPAPPLTSKPAPVTQVVKQFDPISIFLTDKEMVDSGIVFLKSVQYIYSYDVKESDMDTIKFKKQFSDIEKVADENNIPIENVRVSYSSKYDEIKLLPPGKKKTSSSQTTNKPPKKSKGNNTKPQKKGI